MKVTSLSLRKQAEYEGYIYRDFYKHWDICSDYPEGKDSLAKIKTGWEDLSGDDKETQLANLANKYKQKGPNEILKDLENRPLEAKEALMWALDKTYSKDTTKQKTLAYLGAIIARHLGREEVEGRFIETLAGNGYYEPRSAWDYGIDRVQKMIAIPSVQETPQQANARARFAWGYMRNLNLPEQLLPLAVMAIGFSYDPFGEMASYGSEALGWCALFRDNFDKRIDRQLRVASSNYLAEIPNGKTFGDGQLRMKANNLRQEYPSPTPDGYARMALLSQQLNQLSSEKVAYNTHHWLCDAIKRYRKLSAEGKTILQRVLDNENIELDLGKSSGKEKRRVFFERLWKPFKTDRDKEIAREFRKDLPVHPEDIKV